SMDPRQHFTQPPPRYTPASLIKELDEKGIGRPSTYAAIISNIIDREYVAQDERRTLAPTDLGFLVTDLLVESFPDILNVEFTAGMEDELDKIEEGKEKWTKAMKRFYTPFSRDLKKAETEMRDVKRQEVPTEIPCEKCGAMMVIKWGRNGEFLACPQYPECKSTKNFSRDENGGIKVAEEVLRTANSKSLKKCRSTKAARTAAGRCFFVGASTASFSAVAAIPNVRPYVLWRNRWILASSARTAAKAT
ncbi:MAG: topoisomerase, partial [Deltaproteobacteria bacterium]|nr:topoisomerase [Deltaproteobacteria bacterium]